SIAIVQIVRRELIVPLEVSGLRVERENAIRVKVVAGTVAVVAVRPRIPSGPVQGVGCRIVRPGEPGGTAACDGLFSLPGFHPGLGFTRYGPATPDDSAAVGLE